MTTDYNLIAEEYKRAKLQAWRTHIESFTLFNLLGDASGKSALDLACGEGFHTRVLRQKGASRVIGVDISEAMIELGRQAESRDPAGIEYVVADVMELALGETFDIVFAAYLLNYAQTERELGQMCEAIARHLRPGGRFVTINNNPDYTGDSDAMRKYGFRRHTSDKRQGAPVTWEFFLDNGNFEITNYHLGIDAHERALQTAGLRNIAWHAPQVSPLGIADAGDEHWQLFLQHRPVILLECEKS